ncbi:MAG TPA: hypothetical protein VFN09_02475 [Rhodanobacteraceae bacterium]|nr:hypothetical protein [Rhodanobacteraceae bacterium]
MKSACKWLLATVVMAAAPGIALASDVVFVNQSSWDIHEVYLSPASQSTWGEDFLGDDILAHGDELTITDVEEGKWDVKVVDEDGDECVIEDVYLNSDDKWVIKDKDLLACQAAS